VPRSIITLTTDFGLADHFVGAVKGVILNIVPEAEIVDISHGVPAYDILEGALTLAAAYSYFPAGTVHMVVVDPGVGTARRPIIATTERHVFVAPDNGVLSFIYSREPRLRVHHITTQHYFLQPVSQTFHARDVFAPVAAHLVKAVPIETFGDPISDFVRLPMLHPVAVNDHTLRGEVLKVDGFGNLITNLAPQHAPALFQPQPAPFKIVVGQREVRALRTSYGSAPENEIFAIIGSFGYLEIAANRASAAQLTGARRGAPVELTFGTAAAA